jgi:hypothetical protein
MTTCLPSVASVVKLFCIVPAYTNVPSKMCKRITCCRLTLGCLAVDVLCTVESWRREFSGEWIGAKDDSAVTQAVKRLEARMRGDRQLARFSRGFGSRNVKSQDLTLLAAKNLGSRPKGSKLVQNVVEKNTRQRSGRQVASFV